MKPTKKLIEVALPLDAINKASVREKSIRQGHPSTLHLWWSRKPLATARAVIFAQMVDDPSEYVDVLLSDTTKKRSAEREFKLRLAAEAKGGAGTGPELTLKDVIAEHERDRLFDIIKALAKWENTTNETLLQLARDEIWQSWRRTCAKNADHPRAAELFNRHKLPSFHDPFAGGGTLPLEAQRLGLDAFASDLNPVAVLINRAMIEIPQRFANRPPVNPEYRDSNDRIKMEWKGAQGLAEDIRYYGNWISVEATKRIGRFYPKVTITPEIATTREDLKPYIGRNLTVIAWLWARTVHSPNPAFSDVEVPLISTYILSKRKGKGAYIEPDIRGTTYKFCVKHGSLLAAQHLKNGTQSGGSGSAFLCLLSGTPITFDYLRSEAKAGRMGSKLLAIVAQGDRERIYLDPDHDHHGVANRAIPSWVPETNLPDRALGFRVQEYGMTKWKDLFSSRQLVALTTFSDLIQEAVDKIAEDARRATNADDSTPSPNGLTHTCSYAEAVGVYLGFALSKQADLSNTLCTWEPIAQCPRHLFGRQAIPMTWEYAEANPIGNSSGSWSTCIGGIFRAFASMFGVAGRSTIGYAQQQSAGSQSLSVNKVVSTDPPYYDNIGYSDLSDFFYTWMRHSMKRFFPNLFATVTVPKLDELVANPHRHGGAKRAEQFFLKGMNEAMQCLATQAHPAFPVTIYYAFKQAEKKSKSGTSSTGWETFLAAIIRADFTVVGTWPMRTENSSRMVAQGTNALASSIVLVCRLRPSNAKVITLREFISALKDEIPSALRHLQRGSIAPVDLAQAAIGPGMAVYSRYSRVLDATGQKVSVGDALALINQTLDELLAEQEGECDSDSRWAVAWFEQHGFGEGEYGVAETLSKAKNTSIASLVSAKILASKAGRVRLLIPKELPNEWVPEYRLMLTDWEVVHHLIRVLEASGEEAASDLMRQLGDSVGTAHELCYRLYAICEQKKRFAEATSYNALVKSWPELVLRARTQSSQQSEIFS